MRYRPIDTEKLISEFDYLDGAVRSVEGFTMRGGLLRRSTGRIVCGTLKGSSTSCAYVGFSGATWLLHRLVFAWHNGPVPEGMLVDHMDRDRSNNRIGNLRVLTNSQNQMNRGGSRGGALCPYLGVSFRKGRFGAFVSEGSKPVLLGVFDDPVVAARVRDAEVQRRHGSYATLNRDLFYEV